MADKKKSSAKSKSTTKKSKKSTSKTTKKTASQSTAKKTSKAKAKPAKKVKVTKSSSTAKKAEGNSSKSTQKMVINAIVWVLVAILAFAVVDAMVFYLNNVYSAAMVNGSRISQSKLDARLEEEYGKQVLSVMIDEQLIRNEAAANDVTVTEEDIDEYQANQVEQMGGEETFKQALEAEGMTEESYRRDVETILLAQKTVVTNPTDDELKEFYAMYKDSYTVLQETESYDDVDKDALTDIYVSQKFNELAATWLTDLRDDATLKNRLEDEPKFRLFGTTNDVIQDLMDRADDSSDE